jgi:hypothetical protein
MAEVTAGRPNRSWLWAALAALVLIAIAFWAFNRGGDGRLPGEDGSAQTTALDETPASTAQLDANGVTNDEPNPPLPSAAAAAMEPGGAPQTSAGGVADASEMGGRRQSGEAPAGQQAPAPAQAPPAG